MGTGEETVCCQGLTKDGTAQQTCNTLLAFLFFTVRSVQNHDRVLAQRNVQHKNLTNQW